MSVGLRMSFGLVSCLGFASVVGVDGNTPGPAAIAGRLAQRGALAEAHVWMRRAGPSLARFSATIVDGELTAADGAVRALKFAVRDDLARAWWLEHRAEAALNADAASPR